MNNLKTDQRMWDLVRYQRGELHNAGLITNEEYALLAHDHGAVARLETYDQLRAELDAERQRKNVTVKAGTSALTKDLVWCQCGRGLSLSGKWLFCPRCGGQIDQASYAAAVEQAIANGAVLYRDPDSEEVLAAERQKREAAEKLAAEREADTRRRCIEIAEQISAKHWEDYKHGENRADPHYQGLSDGASEVAEAIRAMQESAGRQG